MEKQNRNYLLIKHIVAGRMDGRTSQKQYELAASVVLLFRGSVT